MSRKSDPGSEATNALQRDWGHMFPYAFPPFNLIGKTLQKVKKHSIDMILVTPIWGAQPWYPQLLGMTTCNPIMLPQTKTLLSSPQGQTHHLLENKTLQMGAWLISKMHNSSISESAPQLIISARSSGTRSNYNSHWQQFSSWCSRKQIDPFCCSLNYIINYLALLFDNKKEYRTINNCRSAISAFHEPINGFPVGQHPQVTALLKGISKERPPLPKYTFVCDVDQVLKYMRDKMSTKINLNPKDLTQKLVTLIGLTTIGRSSEIHGLTLLGMCKINNSYEIFSTGNKKHSKQGKTDPPIKIHPFQKM